MIPVTLVPAEALSEELASRPQEDYSNVKPET